MYSDIIKLIDAEVDNTEDYYRKPPNSMRLFRILNDTSILNVQFYQLEYLLIVFDHTDMSLGQLRR